jgi:hypothetical protein
MAIMLAIFDLEEDLISDDIERADSTVFFYLA